MKIKPDAYNEISYCGGCPQFEEKPLPVKFGTWEGKCKKYKIGRNVYSWGCAESG
jgi:hypothetical protein